MAKEVKIIDGVAMTLLLAACSVSDLREYRIPNYLILSGWLSGLAFRLYQGGLSAMGDGAVCIVVSVLVLMPLFCIRAVGAGDVKLLSVISGFYGLTFWGKTGILFLFLAGIASLIHMLRKKLFLYRFQYFIQFILYQRKGIYYQPERDGRDMVIPMTPLLAVAYYLVYMGSVYIGGGAVN